MIAFSSIICHFFLDQEVVAYRIFVAFVRFASRLIPKKYYGIQNKHHEQSASEKLKSILPINYFQKISFSLPFARFFIVWSDKQNVLRKTI